MRRSPAYTLIEILVGITIIGLIFGFGFVSFREFSRRQALVGISKQIKGDLRLAQELALSGKKPENINCNTPNLLNGYNFRVTSSSSYKVEAACTGNNGTSIEVKNVNLSNEITISNPSPNPIIFKSLGQGTNIVQAGTASIVLTQVGTGTTATITVSASGEVR